MLPKRTLLYHRGIDDQVGTYVTDYVFTGVCFVLCVQLITRIRRERNFVTKEEPMTSRCRRISNWAPWNWPKWEVTPINMITYAVVLFGLSNLIVTSLGGLTHHFLQQVEPYHGIEDLQGWLIVWRMGASFSAFTCLSLLIMTEQLIYQEIYQLSRLSRIIYYVIVFIGTFSFFIFNYLPLKGVEDPFSIGQTFIIVFVVMFIYGVTTTVALMRKICCCQGSEKSATAIEHRSQEKSVSRKQAENRGYRTELYTCCKTVVIHCHDSDDSMRGVGGRRWDLILAFVAPWIFTSAGVMNHFLKKKCADSDSAFTELGCPLPDAFNHNAAMHVVQIISTIVIFVAENMAITRRCKLLGVYFSRIATSTTLCNEVHSSEEKIDCKSNGESRRDYHDVLIADEVTNNNEVTSPTKIIHGMTSEFTTEEITELRANNVEQQLPTFPVCDVTGADNRVSVYDNLSSQTYDLV